MLLNAQAVSHVYIYFVSTLYSLLNKKISNISNDYCSKSMKHLEWHELAYMNILLKITSQYVEIRQ